jgi:transposase InsO family protein
LSHDEWLSLQPVNDRELQSSKTTPEKTCSNNVLGYRSRRPDDGAVRSRLRDLAVARHRFGWRRLKVLLSREGVRMKHKKLRRLYVEERLQVRRRIGRKRAAPIRVPLLPAQGPNQRWSTDFVHDTLADGLWQTGDGSKGGQVFQLVALFAFARK